MINLHWLKTFCTLADIGHFTQTAEALFMTQSGVSQHIQKLEQQLGVDLLIRSGKSFSLTEAGTKLYQQGKILLNATDELALSVKQDEPFSGQVKIASPGSVGLKLYPHLLTFQQEHKQLIIDYSFAPNTDIEQKLLNKKIDIGLITEISRQKDLHCQQVALEPLVLVTSEHTTSINWQVLQTLGFIGHPDGVHHANLLLAKNFAEFEHIEQFSHQGFSNQVSLILEPVSRGLGFTVLPLHAAHAFHRQDNIRIHKLKHEISEPLYLCRNQTAYQTRRSQHLQTVISHFLDDSLSVQ